MESSMTSIAWLIAGVCFILSLGGLSQHETSRQGNWLGVAGIVIAILATLFSGLVGYVEHTGSIHKHVAAVQPVNNAVTEVAEKASEEVIAGPATNVIFNGAGLGGYFFLIIALAGGGAIGCLLYTSPSPRD